MKPDLPSGGPGFFCAHFLEDAMNYLPETPCLDEEELADIREVSIDPNLSQEERIAEFLRQIKNPYHFRCGDITVHACYKQDGPSLTECLTQLLG